MPKIEISAGEFLDDYVRPMAQELGGPAAAAYQTFRGALDAVFDLSQKIEFNIPNPFPDLSGGDGDGDGGPPNLLPPLPSLQPIDPNDVLQGLAQAVRNAEGVLNGENLAIGGATLDISLVVQVAGLAGANANLKINIGPTPRP